MEYTDLSAEEQEKFLSLYRDFASNMLTEAIQSYGEYLSRAELESICNAALESK